MLEVRLPPAPAHRNGSDMRERAQGGFSQPSPTPQTRLHREQGQYSPSDLVHSPACSWAVSNGSLCVVSMKGTDSFSSICAKSMLNASLGLSPSLESTFSAFLRRFCGTRARKSTVDSAMLKSAQNGFLCQGTVLAALRFRVGKFVSGVPNPKPDTKTDTKGVKIGSSGVMPVYAWFPL